jgi:hypothetical protein
MPIIIYGSRGIFSDLDSGEFDCPHCQNHAAYRLRQVRRFFTLFFLPLFPVSSGVRFVECGRCGSQFQEAVLDYRFQEVEDGRRALEDEIRWQKALIQLHEGRSLQEVRDNLLRPDEDPAEIEAKLTELCEGRPWRCECGLRYHPNATRCETCGKER